MVTKPDMTTQTGRFIYYNDPSQTVLTLEDFEAPLTNLRRYCGQVDWSLLRHLALCVLLTPSWFPDYSANHLAALALHDLHETIVGDMVTGLKKHCPEFVKIEDSWMRHVASQLGLSDLLADEEIQKVVKFIDYRALVVETWHTKHSAYVVVVEGQLPPTDKEKEIVDAVSRASSKTLWKVVKNALTKSLLVDGGWN